MIYLVMLRVSMKGIGGTLKQRRFLTTAVAINFVVNPLLAWGLGSVFLSGHPDLRIGLILFLVTPCIGWFLLFSELADGDADLGVGILGINIVLQVLLLPVYLHFLSSHSLSPHSLSPHSLSSQRDAQGVDIGLVSSSIVLFLVLPALAAIATRVGADRANLNIGPIQDRIDAAGVKTITLVVIIVSMFASQADTVFDNPEVLLYLIAPLSVFFLLAFVVAIAAAYVGSLSYSQTALLTFTTTSRNSEASLAIAATAFASPLVGLTVVLGPVIELPLLVLMVRALRMIQPRFESADSSSG